MMNERNLVRMSDLPIIVVAFCAVFAVPSHAASSDGQVTVEIVEGIPDTRSWQFETPNAAEMYAETALGLVAVPRKYNRKGQLLDRTNPFMLRARCRLALPAGEYRLLLRSHDAARLRMDGNEVVETDFLVPNKEAHELVPAIERVREPGIHPLPIGHQERMAMVKLDGNEHVFQLDAMVGGKGLRPQLGELSVCIAQEGEPFYVLGSDPKVTFSDADWLAYCDSSRRRHDNRNEVARMVAQADELEYWRSRHELARREVAARPGPTVPDVPVQMPVFNDVDAFVSARLDRRGVKPAPLVNDYSFLRRVTLDTVGVVPTPEEIETFLEEPLASRRESAIDRLLDDPRWADHWTGYWQDVLAENPGLLKPQLNNTGPFRWWIHQAFRDNMPMDRFVTELVRMEGSKYGGGPSGFAMATMNDVPMVAKAHVVAKAFLSVELQCARCHDAPHHPYKQEQLFRLGAMLAQGALDVPSSSTVDLAGRVRQPLVDVTLHPGTSVAPLWPFEDLASAEIPDGIARDEQDWRERLAGTITSPRNDRFAQVIVNRLWKRYLGWGIVEPVDDWGEDVAPSHPDLLDYLARELVLNGYDVKYVARLILNSHTYQRRVQPDGSTYQSPEDRLFASPARRRMSAEQAVDSLFLVAGKPLKTEPLDLAPAGRRPITQFLNLGTPKHAWEFTSLSNDRDRPALSLPFAQTIVDVLTSLGWRESRQNPITVRDETPTVLQPMTLANGTAGKRITTLSDDSAFTAMCLEEQSLPDLVQAVYLRVLSRVPAEDEANMFVELLRDGYSSRRIAGVPARPVSTSSPTSAVSWANHLSPEASRIKLQLAEKARAGDAPTERLQSEWRERMEDMIWALINSPEFLFVP